MSVERIKNNPRMIKLLIDDRRLAAKQYAINNPDSFIPIFEKELRDLGFAFDIAHEAVAFLPKYKKDILPIAIKYYQLARDCQNDNEQNFFLKFFHFKGFDEVVPMLMEDYYSKATPNLTRWYISDCFYQIRSKKYIREYIEIISNPDFGTNRQMIILLLGKLKEGSAIPILIDLLEDEGVRLHAISALSDFKREEFRCHFERFQDSTHSGWRKYARTALKKLDSK